MIKKQTAPETRKQSKESETMQQTVEVNGKSITIKSRPRTSMGNMIGYSVTINGTKCNVRTLSEQAARDYAYAKWIKANV